MKYAFLALLFGSAEILYLDYSYKNYDPFLFMVLFYMFAFSFMSISLFIKRKDNHKKYVKDIKVKDKKYLFYYIGSSAFGNALWFFSLYLLGASGLAILSVAQRIFILYYGTQFLNEKMTKIQYILSVLIILATLAFTGYGDINHYIGVIVSAFSYFFFTLSDIYQKKIANKIKWSIALFLRQLFQMVFFTIIFLTYIFIESVDVSNIFYKEMLLISFITAMLGGVLTKIFHYKAIEVADLTRVTLVEQLKSLIVFFASVFIIGSSMINDYQIIIGIAMLLCFLYFNYIDFKMKKVDRNKK